jgi:hypothetical protein
MDADTTMDHTALFLEALRDLRDIAMNHSGEEWTGSPTHRQRRARRSQSPGNVQALTATRPGTL